MGKKKQSSKKSCSKETTVWASASHQWRLVDFERTPGLPEPARSGATLVSCSTLNCLLLFGGELYNGRETTTFNDVFLYEIATSSWYRFPNSDPSPRARCSHQAVVLRPAVDEPRELMWVFGGGYEISDDEFGHFADTWCFTVEKSNEDGYSGAWTEVATKKTSPSPRSGHRMVAYRGNLLLFGGFFDTPVSKGRSRQSTSFFNDVWLFDTSSLHWMQLQCVGGPADVPSARSGPMLQVTSDNVVVVIGGYTNVSATGGSQKGAGQSKTLTSAVTHHDMFSLKPVDPQNFKGVWQWQALRQRGTVPQTRSGMSICTISRNRALAFGGVFDEESSRDIEGTFFNDLFWLDLDRQRWHPATLTGLPHSSASLVRKRTGQEQVSSCESGAPKRKAAAPADLTASSEEIGSYYAQYSAASAKGEHQLATVSLAGADQSVATATPMDTTEPSSSSSIILPPVRAKAALSALGDYLFLYGGIREDGERQVTFGDFYRLNWVAMDSWVKLAEVDCSEQWVAAPEDLSSSSDDENGHDEEEGEGATSDSN